MTTLADLRAEIADEADDTTGEYTSQIDRAVRAAQRFCERQTYYFNESRDVTFPTVQDQEWYDETDNANIATAVRIVDVFSEDASGQRTRLKKVHPGELETLSDNSASTGEPYCYAYFAQKMRLYPIPDSASYTIRLQVGPYRLAPLASEDDTNAWLTEAYDMIKSFAMHILYRDTLKDTDEALKYLAAYQGEERALSVETGMRQGTGRVVPTCF
mgnify:CR=1 FL=1